MPILEESAQQVELPNSGAPRLSRSPRRHLAVVTCMDSRIDVFVELELQRGDAHVIRNAGGLVTADVLRSLVLSQRRMETTDIIIIQHTDCGLHQLAESDLTDEIRNEVGSDPPFEFGSFTDIEDSVRRGIATVRASLYLPQRNNVRGFVFDVETGLLREIDPSAPPTE